MTPGTWEKVTEVPPVMAGSTSISSTPFHQKSLIPGLIQVIFDRQITSLLEFNFTSISKSNCDTFSDGFDTFLYQETPLCKSSNGSMVIYQRWHYCSSWDNQWRQLLDRSTLRLIHHRNLEWQIASLQPGVVAASCECRAWPPYPERILISQVPAKSVWVLVIICPTFKSGRTWSP